MSERAQLRLPSQDYSVAKVPAEDAERSERYNQLNIAAVTRFLRHLTITNYGETIVYESETHGRVEMGDKLTPEMVSLLFAEDRKTSRKAYRRMKQAREGERLAKISRETGVGETMWLDLEYIWNNCEWVRKL
jgi:hypothetical protein